MNRTSVAPPTAAPPPAADTLFPRLPTTLQPHPNLLKYYALGTLVLGPFFFVALLPMYFRYHTMRYVVEEKGITMRWGILFRREVSLTYARIQDIHLTSNFIERWLGLAKVQVQTASGSSTAEMTIEGVRQFEEMRDFLYARMRGARDPHRAPAVGAGEGEHAALPAASAHALAETLREIADEVRALRRALPTSAHAEEER